MSPLRPLLLLVLLGGCASTPTPQWAELPMRVPDATSLHEACLRALAHQSFKVSESKLSEGTIKSEWDEDLMPFRRPTGDGGVRRRATIEIVEAPASAAAPQDGKLSRLIRVRVEREVNDEIKAPSKTEKAKWVPSEDDVWTARRIAATVRAQFGEDFRPSEDFYRRHGGEAPPAPSPEKPPGQR